MSGPVEELAAIRELLSELAQVLTSKEPATVPEHVAAYAGQTLIQEAQDQPTAPTGTWGGQLPQQSGPTAYATPSVPTMPAPALADASQPPPTAPQAPERQEAEASKGASVESIRDAFREAGNAIAVNLYEAIYKALKEGKETVAGVREPVLQRQDVKDAYQRGELQSAQDLQRFINQPPPATPTAPQGRLPTADTTPTYATGPTLVAPTAIATQPPTPAPQAPQGAEGDWYAKLHELQNRKDVWAESGRQLSPEDETERQRLYARMMQEASPTPTAPAPAPAVSAPPVPAPPALAAVSPSAVPEQLAPALFAATPPTPTAPTQAMPGQAPVTVVTAPAPPPTSTPTAATQPAPAGPSTPPPASTPTAPQGATTSPPPPVAPAITPPAPGPATTTWTPETPAPAVRWSEPTAPTGQMPQTEMATVPPTLTAAEPTPQGKPPTLGNVLTNAARVLGPGAGLTAERMGALFGHVKSWATGKAADGSPEGAKPSTGWDVAHSAAALLGGSGAAARVSAAQSTWDSFQGWRKGVPTGSLNPVDNRGSTPANSNEPSYWDGADRTPPRPTGPADAADAPHVPPTGFGSTGGGGGVAGEPSSGQQMGAVVELLREIRDALKGHDENPSKAATQPAGHELWERHKPPPGRAGSDSAMQPAGGGSGAVRGMGGWWKRIASRLLKAPAGGTSGGGILAGGGGVVGLAVTGGLVITGGLYAAVGWAVGDQGRINDKHREEYEKSGKSKATWDQVLRHGQVPEQ